MTVSSACSVLLGEVGVAGVETGVEVIYGRFADITGFAVFAAGLGIDFAAGRIGTFKNGRGGNHGCQSEQ